MATRTKDSPLVARIGRGPKQMVAERTLKAAETGAQSGVTSCLCPLTGCMQHRYNWMPWSYALHMRMLRQVHAMPM